MTAPEGRLHIALSGAGTCQASVSIRSSQPLGLPRLLAGKTPEQVAGLVPLLYSVCGMAHGIAAAEACESALGLTAGQETCRARRLLALAETVREHIIAVSSWGRDAFGIARDDGGIRRAMQVWATLRSAIDPGRTATRIGGCVAIDKMELAKAGAALRSLIEEQVLGEPAETFAARASVADVRSWSAGRATRAQSLVAGVLDRGWEADGSAPVRFMADSLSHLLPREEGGARRRMRAVAAAEADSLHLASLTPHRPFGHLLPGGEGKCTPFPQEDANLTPSPRVAGVGEPSPAETSPLARQAEHPLLIAILRDVGPGLLARLMARIVELATPSDWRQAPHCHLPWGEGGAKRRMRGGPSAGFDGLDRELHTPHPPFGHLLPRGEGDRADAAGATAVVEAARGRLVHAVQLSDDRRHVQRYVILAPTDWSFHPDGPAAHSLAALARTQTSEIAARARLLIEALDPCVPFDLELG